MSLSADGSMALVIGNMAQTMLHRVSGKQVLGSHRVTPGMGPSSPQGPTHWNLLTFLSNAFLIKLIGLTLDNGIIWVSGVHFYDTRAVYHPLCPPQSNHLPSKANQGMEHPECKNPLFLEAEEWEPRALGVEILWILWILLACIIKEQQGRKMTGSLKEMEKWKTDGRKK